MVKGHVLELLGKKIRARLVCMFKNWKLLFKKNCGNTCGWKSVLKCMKCCLKTKNDCLKTQTKHPLSSLIVESSFDPSHLWV